MNYGFNIPQYTPDILGASNAARNRLLQEQQLKQQGLDKMFNSWAQYGQQKNVNEQAELNRKFQEAQAEAARAAQAEEAARARAAQAVESEKQRQWQSVENELNRDANKADNYAKELRLAQPQYLTALATLQENPNNTAAQLTVAQLKERFPNIDVYNGTNSISKDVMSAALDERKRRTLALQDEANYRDLLKKAKTDEEKTNILKGMYANERNNMNTAEKDRLYAEVKGVPTLEDDITKARNNAAASYAGEKTTENLKKQDIQAKADEAIRDGLKAYQIQDKYGKDGKDVLREVNKRRLAAEKAGK